MSLVLDPGTVEELTDILLNLIDFTKQENRKKINQFVCGLVNSNEKENLKLAIKLSRQTKTGILEIDNPQELYMFFMYIKPWTRHFAIDEKSLLYKIWRLNSSNTSQPRSGEIITEIFEKFLNDFKDISVFTPCLHKRIMQHLESKCSKDRTAGNFLVTKLLQCCTDNTNDGEFNKLHFRSYITIIQCLEVEKCCNQYFLEDKHGLVWMRSLYLRLFDQENISVLRWTLEYIMENISAAELLRANLLREFLTATNREELHNLEDYCLPNKQMKKFLPYTAWKQFLISFVQVPWLNVPLCRWLHFMKRKDIIITQKLLLQFATLVTRIRNSNLRNWAIIKIYFNFQYTIEKLSLIDFVKFWEKLNENGDNAGELAMNILFFKIGNCRNKEELSFSFQKLCFKLFTGHEYIPKNYWHVKLPKLIEKLSESTGVWFFYKFTKCQREPKVEEFLQTEYDINVKQLHEFNDLQKFQEYLLEKLKCKSEEEKQFLLKISVDYFVEAKLVNWTQLEQLNLNPIELLDKGTLSTFFHLTCLIRDHRGRLLDEITFGALLERLDCFNYLPLYKLHYAKKNLKREDKLTKTKIVNCHPFYALLAWPESVPKPLLIQELIFKETTVGKSRIEIVLESSLRISHSERRDSFKNVLFLTSNDFRSQLIDKLLSIREALTAKESNEYPIKIRIIGALLKLNKGTNRLSDSDWQALLALTNPLHLSCLYEIFVAYQLPVHDSTLELLMHKLQTLPTLQSKQQDSIISVVYVYCFIHYQLNLKKYETIFELLSQQIGNVNNQTEIFIQLVLHNLAERFENKRDDVPVDTLRKITPNFSFEDNNLQYLIEARLMLPLINEFIFENVLYMTKGPVDEYFIEDCNVMCLTSH